MLGGWVLFQALLQIVAPGRVVEGTPLRDGRRLQYRINGWSAWWLTGGALGGLVGLGRGRGRPTAALARGDRARRRVRPLMSAANVFTVAFCVYLYRQGRAHPDDGAAGDRAARSTTTSWGRA